ncbi:MAG: hypothetical protein H7174_01770 [Flavobacterium sp.]|nr:hypothetical protein [Flavobacterium sp.]
MFAIYTRKFPFLERQEIWFYDNSNHKLKGNNLFVHALVLPENPDAINIHEVYTTSVDLLQPIENIKANLKTKLRGYINKGERTEFEHKILDVSKPEIQKNIFKEYNHFANQKNISLLKKNTLTAYYNSENMIATQVWFDNKPLITHVYLHDKSRTSLMYSYHLQNLDVYDGQFRSLANRYLHWLDLIYFKSKDFKTYDLGGISKNPNPLSDFKKSFGGIIEEQFGYIIPTGLFKLIFKIRKIMDK